MRFSKDTFSWGNQEVLGRINRILSFHYTLSIWHDTDPIENTESNSSIIGCVFVAAGRCLVSRCLVTLGEDTQTARWSHKLPLFFRNGESRLERTGLRDHHAVCSASISASEPTDHSSRNSVCTLNHWSSHQPSTFIFLQSVITKCRKHKFVR
jgi:hypothetical protein